MSNSHANWLRRAAEEIAKAGHYGWGNTCAGAAEHIDALEAELAALRAQEAKYQKAIEYAEECFRDAESRANEATAELAVLRAELESAHAAQRHAEKELSQYMAWYAMAEHQHLHEQRRAEKAEAELAALRAELHNAEAERDALRERIAALEDEKNTYMDYVGDALGQDHDGESLWDAAQRVLSERDRIRVDRDELAEKLTEAWISRDEQKKRAKKAEAEAARLRAAPSALTSCQRSAFGDLLGHNYWMEAATFETLRRRIIEHWQRAALEAER